MREPDIAASIARIEAVLHILANGWGPASVQYQIYQEDIPAVIAYAKEKLASEGA